MQNKLKSLLKEYLAVELADDQSKGEFVLYNSQNEILKSGYCQVDNEYVVEERTCVTTIKFGRGFSDGDANFILCVAGNNGITPS